MNITVLRNCIAQIKVVLSSTIYYFYVYSSYLRHVDALVLLQAQLMVVVDGGLVREDGAWGRLAGEREARGGKDGPGGLAGAAAHRAPVIRMVI